MSGPAFRGDQNGCKLFCRGRAGFYVYILRRPDERPFYVGKGTGDRVLHHENEARHPNDRLSNSHKLNVIRSIWRSGGALGYEVDSWWSGEADAYAREAALIACLGRLHEGGPLTNRASGGGSVSEPSPFSRQRHAATLAGVPEDNPERAALNRYVLSIAPMSSVVLKPLSQFQPRPTLRFPQVTRKLTLRQAVAVVASAVADGVRLTGSAEVSRRVVVGGVDGFVENGVACDLLTSGSVDLVSAHDPLNERFSLTKEQARSVVGQVGLDKCADLGVI